MYKNLLFCINGYEYVVIWITYDILIYQLLEILKLQYHDCMIFLS